ncbi:MAG: hypothetical protein CR994_05180, partial [Maribacter sp.]
ALDNPGTDDQTLSLSGTDLAIEGGNTVDISSIDTDDQTLTLTGNTLEIADGNSVDLSSIDTDDQKIDAFTFDLSTNELEISLEDDAVAPVTVDLSPLDNPGTDDQNSDEVNNVASSIDLNGDLTVNASDIIDVDGDGSVDATVQDVIEAITPITSKAARIFYPPSIAIDASSIVTGATIDLYQQYLDQYGMTLPSSAKSSSAPAVIPTYTRAELYYYVTYYDPAVFSGVTISDTGIMTYNIHASPMDYNSLINVVFVVK